MVQAITITFVVVYRDRVLGFVIPYYLRRTKFCQG
jgi:hypothetical protein